MRWNQGKPLSHIEFLIKYQSQHTHTHGLVRRRGVVEVRNTLNKCSINSSYQEGSLMCCTFGRAAPLCSSFPSWGGITTDILICECLSTSVFRGPGSAAHARQRAEALCCAAAAVSPLPVCTDYLLPPPRNLSSCRPRARLTATRVRLCDKESR